MSELGTLRTAGVRLGAAAVIIALGAASAQAKTVFEDLDTDGDGVLTREEVLAGQPDFSMAIFIFADRDNDGKLTKREFVRAQSRALQNELTD